MLTRRMSHRYEDAEGHSLFSDVMMPMQELGQLGGPVRMFVFTKMASQANDPTETPRGISSPFKPSKAAAQQMDTLLVSTRELTTEAATLKQVICGVPEFGEDPAASIASFAAQKFTAFKTVADAAANSSKLNGVPLVSMSPSDAIVKEANLSGPTLVALQTELEYVASRILQAGGAKR